MLSMNKVQSTSCKTTLHPRFNISRAGTSFQILLGGGQMPSPSKIKFLNLFFIEFLNVSWNPWRGAKNFLVGAFAPTKTPKRRPWVMPPPSKIEFLNVLFIEFWKVWKRADHPLPPTCSRNSEWYCYFAWVYFDKFSFSTKKRPKLW